VSINYSRITALIFLLFFVLYSYFAREIVVFDFDVGADFNAKTFPILISYLGIGVSFLTFVLCKNDGQTMAQYEWLGVIVLFVLVFTYGIIIKSIGFFLSTNLFLLVAYYYLGARSYKVLLLCSLPVVGGMQFMLHQLLGVYIRDPFLNFLGIIS